MIKKNIFSFFFVYLLLFAIIYFVHINFFYVNVLLYSLFFDVFISLILTYFIFYKKALFEFRELNYLIVIAFSIGCFFIMIPTIIDRSLSIFLLQKIDEYDGNLNISNLDQIFKEQYMKEHEIIKLRITEQLESDTIELLDNCVKLTKKGEIIVKVTNFYRKNLLPKKRLVLDEYTDKLTKPFNNKLNITNDCN